MISLKKFGLQALAFLLTLTVGSTDLSASWSEPQTYVTGPLINSSATSYTVSSDPSGTTSNALGVWVLQDAVNNTFNIRGSFFNGTSWDPTTTTIASISANNRSIYKKSQVNIHSTNKGVAIWTKFDGVANEYSVEFSAYNGTSWSPVSTLPGSTLSGVDGSLLDFATLSIDPTTGQGASNWVSYNGTQGLYTLYASIYNGTSWSAPKVVSQVSGTLAYQTPFLFLPSIAVYNEGGSLRAVSAWTHGLGTSENIEFSVYDGSSWSAPEIVSTVTGPGSFSDGVVIALSPSTGNGILGWNTFDSSTLTYNIVSANYVASTKEVVGVTILESLDTYATEDNAGPVKLSVNSVGQGVLVWNSNPGPSTDLYASIFDGTSWNTVLAKTTAGSFTAWDVSVNPTGTNISLDSKAAIILFNERQSGVSNIRSLTLTGVVWTQVPPAAPAGTNFIHRSAAASSVATDGLVAISQSGQGNGVGLWNYSTSVSQIALLSSAYSFGGDVWSPTAQTALTTYPAPFILENIFGGSSQNDSFQFANNGAGNALSIWTPYVSSTTTNNGTASVYASFLSGTTWQTPQLLSQVTSAIGVLITGEFVGIDALNNGAAIWLQPNATSTSFSVMGASFVNGAWSSPTPLVGPVANTFSQDIFALNPAGQGVATWRRSTGTLEAVPYAGNNWGTLSTIVAAVNAPQNPAVALDGSGNAVVVYRTTAGLDRRIDYVRYNRAANTWSPFTTIASMSPSDSYAAPVVVLDPSGKGFAVWSVTSTATGFTDTIRLETSSYNGTSWTAPITLFTLPTPRANLETIGNFSAGIAPDGKGSATWAYYDGVRTTQVFVANYDGSGWSTPQVLDTVYGGDNSTPAITRPFVNYNSSGNGLLTWRAFDNTFLRQYIKSSVYDKSTGLWSPAETAFASIADTVALPRSGIDDSNRGIAGTISVNAGSSDASLITVFGSGLFAPSPASNLKGKVIKEKFATQTDIIHRLKWTASADPTVTSYLIYRNGVLIAEVSAKAPLRYYDHNRRPKVVDHYTVYAVNSVGQSTGVSVDVP